jgi:hypothetical protein
MDFKTILDKGRVRSEQSISVQMFAELKKITNPEDVVRRDMAGEISKQIENKIEFRSQDEETMKWYERWTKNQTTVLYPLPNQNYPPVVKYESELMVFSPKELFELMYSFNQLSQSARDIVVKHLSPNEEEYLNQVRHDKLTYILDEDEQKILT